MISHLQYYWANLLTILSNPWHNPVWSKNSDSTGFSGEISRHWYCWYYCAVVMTTTRRGSTGNQGVSGPHPLRRSVYHEIRGNVSLIIVFDTDNAGGSCWIPGSYTPCTGLKHLILNGFFQSCRIGRDLLGKPVKTTCYAKLDQLRPWNPIWACLRALFPHNNALRQSTEQMGPACASVQKHTVLE